MFISFFLVCLVVELTPGPNMMYLALLSSLKGKKAGFSMVAGISLGLFIIGLVTTYGAQAFFAGNTAIYQTLRWAGVLYMAWLAWDAWPRKPMLAESIDEFDVRYFRRGLITNILNPKAAIFYITVFPSFVDEAGDKLLQSVVMIVAYVSVATSVHAGIAMLASRAGRLLQEGKLATTVQKIFSLLLLLVAVWIAWSTR